MEEKEIIQQSDCVAFADGFVWGYNDELCISHPTDTELEGAVRAKEFKELLKKVKNDDISLATDENQLTVSWGKKKEATFRIEEVEMPLDEIEIPAESDWQGLPDNFCEAVKFVLFSAGTDPSHTLLTCVHVEGDKAETCDNVRMCRFNLDDDCDEMLIPFDAAKEIIKYNPTQYFVGEGWLYFQNEEETVVCCRTYGESYPDINKLIPEGGEEIQFPDGMMEVLDRAKVFAKDDKLEQGIVWCSLEGGSLEVSAQSQAGNFREPIDMEYKGEPLSFGTNPGFFADALKIMNSAEIDGDHLMLKGDNFIHVVCLEEPGGE